MVGTNFDAPHYIIFFPFFCDFVLCQNIRVIRSQFDDVSCLQVHSSNRLHEETDIDQQSRVFLTVPCRVGSNVLSVLAFLTKPLSNTSIGSVTEVRSLCKRYC